ncbi:hypothetical protein PALB_22640 [Pseudoalteromonas luteoviolacea B = ATCC 29581]|nr:hypothetical protein PALB_22640 [Pseudoalteromonas luteoviolacea B = ATCC 29581]
MTTIFWCALAMILLPYFAKVPVAILQQKDGGYDNHLPRQQQARLTGLGARAVAAHQNSFEAAIVFSIALAATLGKGDISTTQEWLFITFIVLRALFCVLYWLDKATLRSLVWLMSMGCIVAIMLSVL